MQHSIDDRFVGWPFSSGNNAVPNTICATSQLETLRTARATNSTPIQIKQFVRTHGPAIRQRCVVTSPGRPCAAGQPKNPKVRPHGPHKSAERSDLTIHFASKGPTALTTPIEESTYARVTRT
jgi:hypothetical protein